MLVFHWEKLLSKWKTIIQLFVELWIKREAL